MNKIINWTFGSVFRTFGRIIAYLLIGGLICLILSKNDVKIIDLIGIGRVYAAEISVSKRYRYQPCSTQNDLECNSLSSWINAGTWTNNTNMNYTVQGYSVEFYSSDKVFSNGVTYRLTIITNQEQPNGTTKNFNTPTSYTCRAEGETDYITSCSLVSYNSTSSGNIFIFDLTPNRNVDSLRVNFYTNSNSIYSRFRLNSSSSVTYDSSTNDITNNANQNANNIMNNNNTNTQNIINNQNTNTQNIINNQNTNSQNQISSQNVCRALKYGTNCGYIGQNGVFNSQNCNDSNNRTIDYLEINSQSSLQYIKAPSNNGSYRLCFYDNSKTYISCVFTNQMTEGQNITIPQNAKYIRYTANITTGMRYYLCSNGNQALNDSINDLQESINQDNLVDSDIKNTLDDLNVDSQSLGFFSTFLTLPLTWVQNILSPSNNSCSNIVLPLPYVNTNLTLPCMRSFWNSLGVLGDLITALWICVVGVRIFNGLFVLTIDSISSKDNDDELTKIKSWEL